MQEFHEKAFDLYQLIQKKLNKPNKWNIEEAETMAGFLKYTHSLAVSLDQAKKQLSFMQSLLSVQDQVMFDDAIVRERDIIKTLWDKAEDQRVKDSLLVWAKAVVKPLKDYEARQQNKAGKK